MIIYGYSPITKEYVGQDIADESPLEKGVFLIPAYTTTKQPPQLAQNQVALYENNNWIIKDDYRAHKACEIDFNGFFVKQHEFIIGEKPSTTIVLANIPQGFYKPKFVKGEWVEELTEEELNVIKNAPKPKTLLEKAQDNINSLGTQLAQEKISNIQKDNIIKNLGTQLTQSKLEDFQNKAINNSLGKQLA